jgi:hypothetical protein
MQTRDVERRNNSGKVEKDANKRRTLKEETTVVE